MDTFLEFHAGFVQECQGPPKTESGDPEEIGRIMDNYSWNSPGSFIAEIQVTSN